MLILSMPGKAATASNKVLGAISEVTGDVCSPSPPDKPIASCKRLMSWPSIKKWISFLYFVFSNSCHSWFLQPEIGLLSNKYKNCL